MMHAAVEEIRPPFDLVSDMLFAAARAPAAPFKGVFPDVPVRTLGGTIFLLLWFSRIKDAWYRGQDGERHRLDKEAEVLYNELNIAVLLSRRALFVPAIYATGELTIRLSHFWYGMPKRPATMNFDVRDGRVESVVEEREARSSVRARLIGSGAAFERILARRWPWRSWPACFPSGTHVRACITAAPRLHPARVVSGRLALPVDWLPDGATLLPFGLYAGNLAMRLPVP